MPAGPDPENISLLEESARDDGDADAAEGLDTGGGKEGEFIRNIVRSSKKAVGENDDITSVILNLATNGTIENMAKEISAGVDSGELEAGRLMSSIQSALGGVAKGEPPDYKGKSAGARRRAARKAAKEKQDKEAAQKLIEEGQGN